jgi:membrane-associated phospholipid phosphatase
MNLIGKQLVIFVLWTSFLYIGYQLTNHHQLFEMHLMPKILSEEKIPFLIWSVLPYLLLIDLMYLPIFIKTEGYFKKAFVALTIAVLINYLVFIFYPTYMERPIPPPSEGFFNKLYLWLLSIDGPANCFPSGHITSPGIGCWYFAKAYPKSRFLLLFLFSLLCLSVLTTKQHYILDILGGISTGAIGICLANYFTTKK